MSEVADPSAMRPHPPVFDAKYVVGIVLAAIIPAATAYGMLQGTVARSADDIKELQQQLRDMNQISQRVAVLDSNFGSIDKRLERIENALQEIAKRAQEFKSNTRIR